MATQELPRVAYTARELARVGPLLRPGEDEERQPGHANGGKDCAGALGLGAI